MKLLLPLLVLFTLASPAVAQQAPATGSMTVVPRGLSAVTVPNSPRDRLETAGGLTIERSFSDDGAALIRVGGDADRVYRIRLPEGAREVAIWSFNVGDVTHTRLARLDFTGHDTLRVSSDEPLIFVDEAGRPTAMPLSIDYE
jgi:hypothetical protein